MKRYSGQRLPNGTVRVYVDAGGRRRILPHLVRHSATGFDSGAPGPRARDLARSVLADYRGAEPAPPMEEAFARRFIAPLDRAAPRTISGAEIAAWLALLEAQEPAEGI